MSSPLSVAIIVVAVPHVEFGGYNVGADAPHTVPVRALLNIVRQRSIVVRARDIKVPPDLTSSQHILMGAGLYSAMCTPCRGGPGLERTELAQGLYPQAPDLAKDNDFTPAQEFWIIKHGVKMTAMPA